METWLALLLMFVALMAVMVAWDLMFCGGQRCKELSVRLIELAPWTFRRPR